MAKLNLNHLQPREWAKTKEAFPSTLTDSNTEACLQPRAEVVLVQLSQKQQHGQVQPKTRQGPQARSFPEARCHRLQNSKEMLPRSNVSQAKTSVGARKAKATEM